MSTSGSECLACARALLWRHGAFVVILLFAAVFATYRLNGTPTTGYDEGILVQMAANAADHGAFDIRIGPGAYMSTGFPALAPIALSFRLFGTGLLQARLVIVAFLLTLLCALYAGALRMFGKRAAVFSVALLATHASLYAYGKVVLDEIPGLCYLTLFFLGLYATEASVRDNDGISSRRCFSFSPQRSLWDLPQSRNPFFSSHSPRPGLRSCSTGNVFRFPRRRSA